MDVRCDRVSVVYPEGSFVDETTSLVCVRVAIALPRVRLKNGKQRLAQTVSQVSRMVPLMLKYTSLGTVMFLT